MKTILKKVAAKKTVRTSAKQAEVISKTKKVTKKNTAIKAITPKKLTAKIAKKDLVIADNDNSFWMNDGQILNSLTALEVALSTMDKVVYDYHTANGRHDFANWVEDVLDDVLCATALRKAKSAKSARTVVVKYLKFYTK